MKKDVKIYKHNKEAFKNVLEAFKETNRTCVIHPTGTGKMFIALQLMDKFKNKRIAYLTSYISIIDKLHSDMEMTDVNVKNLYTEVYCNLKPSSGFDYIILDEFHHVGAPIWGANVKEFIELNPDAKVLGLTATPIRFLDNNRDMVDELFDNNVASYMKLEKAIVDGILQFPTYVTAVYEFDDIINKYERRISRIKNSAVSDAREKLEKARRTLENAEGVEEVVEKYITNKNGRYIVFCRNFAHLDLMTKECSKWMHRVNPNITIYAVKSDIDSNINRKTLSDFESNTDDSLKLLFCVDMLNEGIHVKNDGCIMLRPTESYNVYLQQLGRVLAVGHESGVVLDIVNNAENLNMVDELKNNIINLGPNNKVKKHLLEKFKASANVKKAKEVLNELDYIIYDNTGWDVYYRYAKDYYEKHGNLLVPENYIVDDVTLIYWIKRQRTAYKNHTLSQEKISMLEDIGMIWDMDHKWMICYNLAKDFYIKNGHLIIPQKYTVDGINLYNWIQVQCKSYKNHTLSQERISMLEDIGMIWNRYEYKWMIRYNLAKDFYIKNGHLITPTNYTVDGINLHEWLSSQREAYKNHTLSQERISMLESIGMIWYIREYMWMMQYNLAKDFYIKNGHLIVPYNYMVDNVNLYAWIDGCRSSYRDNKLSQEKISMLEDIGMIWDIDEYKWMIRYNLAKEFYIKNGHLIIPRDYIVNDINLGLWIKNMSNNYRDNKLSQERISMLEDIGMIWNRYEYKWMIRYNLAKDFYIKNGHLITPTNYTVDGINLHEWLSKQRTYYRKSILSKERIDLLNAIGMVWDLSKK